MGIAPYGEETDRFFVGADAHIGPEAGGMGVYVFSDRSGIVPSGAMWASPPTSEPVWMHALAFLLQKRARSSASRISIRAMAAAASTTGMIFFTAMMSVFPMRIIRTTV